MASKKTTSASLEAALFTALTGGAKPQTGNPRFLEHDVSGNCQSPVPIVIYGHASNTVEHVNGETTTRHHPACEILRWVQCRDCDKCRLYTAQHWAGRAVREIASTPGRTWFVTLTYSPEAHVRRSWEADGDPDRLKDLYVADVQKLMKRIRKKFGVRYLAAAERHPGDGPNGEEIHWHLLLHEAVPGSLTSRYLSGNQFEGLDSKVWPHGHLHCRLTGQDTTDQRRAWYVCKYIRKERVFRVLASQRYGD